MIVLAEVKFAVFGDYDGNAPETKDLGVFDTEEEANRVAELLEAASQTAHLQEDLRDEEDEPEEKEARAELERLGVEIPYTEGFQWSLSFKVREVLVRVTDQKLVAEQKGENTTTRTVDAIVHTRDFDGGELLDLWRVSNETRGLWQFEKDWYGCLEASREADEDEWDVNDVVKRMEALGWVFVNPDKLGVRY